MPEFTESVRHRLRAAYRILEDDTPVLSPERAEVVWSALRLIMSLEKEDFDRDSNLEFLWDGGWDAVDLVGPQHRALLPYVMADLKDDVRSTVGYHHLCLFALNVLQRIGGDLHEAVPLVKSIAEDRQRRFRGEVGSKVRGDAAWLLKKKIVR